MELINKIKSRIDEYKRFLVIKKFLKQTNIEDEIGNKFYFIFSEDFINRIKLLEEQYPNLKALSKKYSLDLIINQI